MSRFYVTTPIYYVNDAPHLGHIYTTVAADVMARYHRMQGDDVFFLTGLDEHGQKVQESAEQKGVAPQELADQVCAGYQTLWPQFGISNDDFIRTTEPRHHQAVRAMWARLEDAGAIYLGHYEDWYCVPCETYWTETQLKDADMFESKLCPDCGRPVEKVQEESYFFRLSDYQDRLLEHFKQHPDFIGPDSRRNEVMRFVESGLNDLSISRRNFSWGIRVPGHEDHVVYVWIDALTNYLTAIGFPGEEKVAQGWPASLHLIGKDILRFHAVYWPCLLMAAGLPLPKRIYAHGWWTVDGEKMSKSKGNVVKPDDMLAQEHPDVLRYFMLREVSFGQDGDFSWDALQIRYNSELANDLGNLLNRSLSMLHKYQDGVIQTASSDTSEDQALKEAAEALQTDIPVWLEKQQFQKVLEQINAVVRLANRYIEVNAPWKLAKDDAGPDAPARLNTVLYHLVETLRLVATWLHPFMPEKSRELLTQLYGATPVPKSLILKELSPWGGFESGHCCGKPTPVFPRKDSK